MTYEHLAELAAWAAVMSGGPRVTLDDLLGQPAWMRDGACREHAEVNFFPRRGEPSEPAKTVCRGCLVLEECFAFAMKDASLCGVWGGTSERERRSARVAAGSRRNQRYTRAA